MIAFQLFMQIIIPLSFVLVCFVVGKGIELHHFKTLAEREQRLSGIIVTNLKTIPPKYTNAQPILVMGSAVIATDYFKVFAAGLRKFFGGEMKSILSKGKVPDPYRAAYIAGFILFSIIYEGYNLQTYWNYSFSF